MVAFPQRPRLRHSCCLESAFGFAWERLPLASPKRLGKAAGGSLKRVHVRPKTTKITRIKTSLLLQVEITATVPTRQVRIHSSPQVSYQAGAWWQGRRLHLSLKPAAA